MPRRTHQLLSGRALGEEIEDGLEIDVIPEHAEVGPHDILTVTTPNGERLAILPLAERPEGGVTVQVRPFPEVQLQGSLERVERGRWRLSLPLSSQEIIAAHRRQRG